MKLDLRLYLVTDELIPFETLLFKVEEAIKGGVTIVQLREKQANGKTFYEKAIKLKKLLDQYNIPLIINDRVDIALAVGADGIHIGQKDIPLQAVRKIASNMVIGVSVSTPLEAIQAEKDGADYIGVGSVFPTESKEDAEILPYGMLDSILASVHIPAVAIGGINLHNVETLKRKSLAGLAVVSGILHAPDPLIAATLYREK
ncbi:thiamine phosphate synthase [Bacillus andreraoultii]|uniref:thiamine phosphate synthase n=1 Tax=Bacillus andreraoultii TaxID=1499685 RepID=UPI00053AECF1|nr:thiamine phosphate synthase [Bacillus andreraoultii]